MGKSNKANRTKGNTRPSSSEQSAKLLNQSGRSFSGFIGFEALKDTSYVPVTGQHSSDDPDLSVDSDFRMVMRKMLKRDSVTRLKAIQEFGDLCTAKDKDSVKNVLPFWPRLFNKLALDYDRRIREATHHANGKLISNVKREIAPYLKNIMGVWLLGQNDLHAPAASAAQAAFTDTFPKPKQSEALMYCKAEIFAYFKDNLFEQTAKSMSEPYAPSPEDVENKYTLVISATLQAMKLFLVTVSQNEISNMRDEYFSVVAENKFWKYAKNKEAQIRGSWYTLISYLCHVKPDLFAEMEKKLVAAVFGCLAESDPLVASHVWESALNIVINFANCWQGISINKVVLPQLWTHLNEGARGNAHVVYPCILPFLSKFPREVISKEAFLSQFFTSLRHSLTLNCVKSSTMECDAVLTTFIECLQYISLNVLEITKEGPALLEKVISDHVIPLVETSFYDNKYSHLATSKFYPLLGSLIQKLENKCLNESEEISKTLTQTLTVFWNNIYSIFLKIFDKKPEEKKRISLYITYFFHSTFILSPTVLMKADKSKVRFEDDEQPEEFEPQVSSEDLPSVEMYDKMPFTFKQMIKFINVLCSKTDESIDLCYLKILDEILASTLNTMFLKDILKSYEEADESQGKSSLTFFNKIILKWVSNSEFERSSMICITDIIFSMCSSVTSEEAMVMLNTCCKVKNPVFLECILSKGLGIFVHEPIIQNWLKSPVLVDCILKGFKEMMESLTQDETKSDELIVIAHKNVLLTCLVNKDLQETLEKNKSIEEMFLICKELMAKGLKCRNVDCIIDVSCAIIETALQNCKVCWDSRVTDDLLSLIFHWNLNNEKYGISEKASKAFSQVLHAAVYSSCNSCCEITMANSFILRAAKELNSSLNCLVSSQQASQTLFETSNLLYLVEEVLLSLPGLLCLQWKMFYPHTLVLSKLLENILPTELQWEKLKQDLVLSLIPSFLKKKVFYPFPTENNFKVPEESVFKVFMAATVVSEVFVMEIERMEIEDEKYFEHYVTKHLSSLLWCLSYGKGNGYMNEDIKHDVKTLERNCIKILSYFSDEKLQTIIKDYFYRSLDVGHWGSTFAMLLEITEELHPEYINLFTDLISDPCMLETDHSSFIRQILSHHVTKEKKVFHLKELLSDLTNTKNDKLNDDFLSKLAEVCCFIQGSEVLDDEVQSLLLDFSSKISCFDCSKEMNFLFSLQMTSLMSSIVQHVPHIINKSTWDYMQMLLSSSIEAAKLKKFNNPQDLLLLSQVSSLYSTSHTFVNSYKDMGNAWIPSVSDKLNEDFLLLFVHAGDVIKKFKPLIQAFEISLAELLYANKFIPEYIVFQYIMMSSATSKSSKSSSADKTSTPLDCLSSILLSDIQHLQLAAHTVLIKAMPLLSETLSNTPKKESDDNEDEEEKVPSKLLPLVDILNVLNELIESMLGDILIGECCLLLPDTDPYAFVSAYLFAWLQMLEFISSSASQVRSGYITHLEETKLLSSLFSNVFCLMPENLKTACMKKESMSETPKKENLVSLFLNPPEISAGNQSPEEIQALACYVFCTAMRRVPASIRTWWNNLDNKSSDFVNRFTSKYISGVLCTEEIQTVQNSENLFKNMVVKARLGTREVIAIYTVDDYAIELCVQLPINYPLGPITAEKRGKVVIPQQEWRQWLMQLTTVLTYQNGSILDGLSIWKKNLDKKFEGVEECMICYYILHSSSLKLPKLSCNVCRKKFHSACLYKWFHSSNNFTCPLCRNEFII